MNTKLRTLLKAIKRALTINSTDRRLVLKVEEYDHVFGGYDMHSEAILSKEETLELLSLADDRPKIICLCGSSRFCCEIAVKKWELEKQGHIAIGMHLLPAGYSDIPDHLAEAEGVSQVLDQVHLRKIDIADEVLVINKGGYIGERTRIEIEYAKAQGKPVEYLEQ